MFSIKYVVSIFSLELYLIQIPLFWFFKQCISKGEFDKFILILYNIQF